MSRKFLSVIWLILFFFNFGFSKEIPEKKETIQSAVKKGELSPYHIPFDTYVKLGLWDELNAILEDNNNVMTVYSFPGRYYSRPYIVNHHLWIFGNTAGQGVHVVNPDTLKLEKVIKNPRFMELEGGIRQIAGDTVISGASDEDVDTAVVWNTSKDTVSAVPLEDGHYISSIAVESGKLYIGSCGEKIGVWDFDNLKFLKTYSVSPEKTSDWQRFNEKECIIGIYLIGSRIFGIGEKTVFIWNKTHDMPIARYKKLLPNSSVTVYKQFLIEYRDNRFIVRHIESGTVIKDLQTNKPIEDLIGTPDQLIAEHSGDMLVLSLRHNQGISFYDFKEFRLLRHLEANGRSLAVHRNTLFATDDGHLYRYRMIRQQPSDYERFVKSIELDRLNITQDNYAPLLKLSRQYPQVISPEQLVSRFLNAFQITVRHSLKFGRLQGNAKITSNSGKNSDDRYGFRMVYEVANRSPNWYVIMLASEWSGSYGKPAADVKEASFRQSFFVAPNNGVFQNEVDIGDREPKKILLYPVSIRKVSQAYHDEFMSILKGDTSDIDVIDRYLKDESLKDWHKALTERKTRLLADQKNRSWLYRLFHFFR